MKYVFRKKRLQLAAGLMDAVGFLLRPKRKRALPQPLQKILIIRLDHLGDIFYATALPKLLREHFPHSSVDFLTNDEGQALLECNPYVNRVWQYPVDWYQRFGKSSSHQGSSRKQVRTALKNERYDLIISMRGDLRENWLTRRLGPKMSIGYGMTGGGFLLDRCVPHQEGSHHTRRTLDLLSALGIHAAGLRPKIYFDETADKQYGYFFSSLGIAQKKAVVFQMDAGAPAKTWPDTHVRRFFSLYEAALSAYPLILIGGSGRPSVTSDEIKRSHPKLSLIDLRGKTRLRELFYLLKHARAYIGHDSGPSHISAFFDIPTLFLYSGTNRLSEWKCLAESADILWHPVPCSPCHQRTCKVAGHPCMSSLEPVEAVRWLQDRLHVR